MEREASASGDAGRDPRLDGLRGLAILLVILFHVTRYARAQGGAAVALTAVPSLGWSGVDLFFVLSGFLITGILLRTKRSSNYYRAFYARRALRIFPLYYVALLLFLVILPRLDLPAPLRFNVGSQAAWFWTYLVNLKISLGYPNTLLDLFWSLSVEEHFYLLWPWIVRRSSERALLAVCGAVVAGAFVLRTGMVLAGVDALAVYTLTPCRLDALAVGAAIAVIAGQPGGLARVAQRARIAAPLGLLAFGALAFALRAFSELAPEPGAYGRTFGLVTQPAMQTAGFSLIALAWGASLVCVATAPRESWLARCFEAAWLRHLGLYSYAMYVFHLPLFRVYAQLVPGTRTPYLLWQIQTWIAMVVATYLLARLSWALVEGPILRWKRHFPYRV